VTRFLGVVLAVLLSACSSTNRPSGRGADSSVPEASALAGGAPDGAAPPEAHGGSPKPGTKKGARATAGKGAASGGSSAGAAATGQAPSGPIRIGFHFSNNANAAAQFGANRLPSEGRTESEALVKSVNRNGGIHGRQIEFVWHTTDPLQGTFDAQTQAACEYFRDEKVFAVLSDALTPSTVLATCLANAKIPLVWTYEYLVGKKFIADYGDWIYMPQLMWGKRLGFIIDGLVAQGLLRKENKIAVVRYDTPTHVEYLNEAFKPRIAVHGLNLVADQAFSQPRSAGDAGAVSAQASSAMLDLQTKGVDRVVFMPTGAALPLLFMAAAESQGFRPLYGLSSLDPPVFLAANFKGTQLRGARAVAWLPAGDVEAAQDPGLVSAEKRCKDAVRDGGSPADGRTIIAYCEGLFLLKDALDRTTDHTASGLRKAVEALGSSWKDPRTFQSVWGPGRHDAAAAYGAAYYDESCSCFKYVNPSTTPVP
jgi:ABC-type branched-subunit amino acid transport system substrate-binding protein